ncbi:hypothetical protein [Mycobacterium simiae]|nr:hypothetical protein [Mycobacterium simiae]PLV46970.1 hypothetical protein X011_20885 [Mycobacterium tuberculosis variant microti OV254]BBX43427.1 hypothetical protein MSIM_48780 [Mycobacterium simiae]
MDAVERGDCFTVTRARHQIAESIPDVGGRRFVSRAEFARGSQVAPLIDLTAFRADQKVTYHQALDDAYAH